VLALTSTEISAMTMDQASALDGSAVLSMGGAQLDAWFGVTAVSPVVLDLNGNGVNTMSARDGVNFDLNATGSTSPKYGWAAGGDGLLVRDLNHDGVINDGKELFGSATVLSNGQRAGDGYRAMLDLDSNHDHKLSTADTAFKELQIWVDANHDGKTDAGELKSLAELGIIELDLNAQSSTQIDHGNLLGLVSSYKSSDGSSHAMADVWFSKDTATSPATGPAAPALGDLLADPGHSLHEAAPTRTANAPTADTAQASLQDPHAALHLHRIGADLDGPLQHQPLI
jgi:hypothetical protein